MDLIIQFILAILPILMIFIGLVFFRQSGTLMGVLGWILTVIIAVVFFQTDIFVALAASWYGCTFIIWDLPDGASLPSFRLQ